MRTFLFVAFIWLCGTVSQALTVKRNENEATAAGAPAAAAAAASDSGDRLQSCRAAGHLEQCAERYSLKLSLEEVFRLMTVDPNWLTAACHETALETCLGNCQGQFQASKYGYTYSICTQRDVIRRQPQCWDGTFPEDARRCFHWFYPPERQQAFYPTPFQVYDKATIARLCFPDDSEPCRQHKAHVLYYLMPQYYEVFQQPLTW